MLARDIGFLVGGVLGIYLFSRLAWWLARRWKNGYGKALRLDFATYVICSFGSSFGMANGGQPQYLRAFSIYLLPALIVLAIDLFRIYRERQFTENLIDRSEDGEDNPGSPKVLTTGERRTHLFAHRLGLTLSILGGGAGLLFIGGLAVDHLTGFEKRAAYYQNSADEHFRKSLSAPVGSKGDYGTQAYFVGRFSDDQAEHDRILTEGRYADLAEYLLGMAAAIVAAMAFYGVIRAVGWIAASLFA